MAKELQIEIDEMEQKIPVDTDALATAVSAVVSILKFS